MTNDEYNTLKKLAPSTLNEIRKAIYEFNCSYPHCVLCPLSIHDRCVCGVMNNDKELDVI